MAVSLIVKLNEIQIYVIFDENVQRISLSRLNYDYKPFDRRTNF